MRLHLLSLLLWSVWWNPEKLPSTMRFHIICTLNSDPNAFPRNDCFYTETSTYSDNYYSIQSQRFFYLLEVSIYFRNSYGKIKKVHSNFVTTLWHSYNIHISLCYNFCCNVVFNWSLHFPFTFPLYRRLTPIFTAVVSQFYPDRMGGVVWMICTFTHC